MRYTLTPLNIFCTLLAGLEIVFFVFPQALKNEHYGYQHIYLIPVILVGLLIDYILQKLFKKYSWLILMETIIIVSTILLNIKF
jgi:hypothetical protein